MITLWTSNKLNIALENILIESKLKVPVWCFLVRENFWRKKKVWQRIIFAEKIISGSWQLTVGRWQLTVGRWQLAGGSQ